MTIINELFHSGLNALLEYLSMHVLTCLVPAFFIAGAIAVFVSQASILKYFGPGTKKFQSYGVASVSGAILAVCSCTVLPLFGSIYKRGAGIGPAIAFLYSGPAINVLAIVYSARILGYNLGIARAIGAIVFAVGIGFLMSLIYRKENTAKDTEVFETLCAEQEGKSWQLQVIFITTLVSILIFAAAKHWVATGVSLAILGGILWRWFTKSEIRQWMRETLRFVRLVIPWLLVGVFVAGIIVDLVPERVIVPYVGGNSLFANFIASLVGALMYFATLTEVPIIKAFMDLGMGKGPALSLLLAGPALSLPNMLAIRSIMGAKKTLTYVALVVVFATISGYIFGLIAQ